MVSTCGVMFASRPEAAAGELARVCRPGGRIALTTWMSDGNVFKMFQVMKRYMPPPPAPAPPSPFEWGRPIASGSCSGAPSSCSSSGRCRITASRAPRRHGTRSRPATARRDRWPRASTRNGARRSRGLHRVPRRLRHGARHLRAARILADGWGAASERHAVMDRSATPWTRPVSEITRRSWRSKAAIAPPPTRCSPRSTRSCIAWRGASWPARRRGDARRDHAAARSLPGHLGARSASRFPIATASWAMRRGSCAA